jgi:S1-C subfamily serine protease
MKKTMRWLPLLLLVMAMLACSTTFGGAGSVPTPTLAASGPSTNGTGKSPDVGQEVLVDIYQRVSPGVVYIQVTTDQGGGEASGFVYDTEGHIVTNYHVVDGATTIEVDFPSGFKAYGKVVGTDLDSDIAVIKVDGQASDFTPLPLGDSEQVKVGQTVVAIGNPFGYSGSMTVGIVSAKGRTLDSEHLAPDGTSFYSAGDMIQTDAAINPGNSGGPLLDMNGDVIGVNRAIVSTSSIAGGTPSSSGIGFAVPVNMVKRVVPSLIKNGSYDYPYLGISSIPELNLALQAELKLPQATGAYVTNVVKGGPSDLGGLLGGTIPTSDPNLMAGGDLIIAVDGQPVMVFGNLLSYIQNNKGPGDTVVFTVIRDNQQKEVSVTLGKRP